MRYTVLVGERVYQVRPGANQTVEIDGEAHQVDLVSINGTTQYSLLLDNRSWEVLVQRQGDEFRISIGGKLYLVTVQDERTRKIQKALAKPATYSGDFVLRAPMPGLVRGVPVQVGDQVAGGQGLVVLEAMKMENELRAPRPGTIMEVRIKPGETVEQGQVLVIIK